MDIKVMCVWILENFFLEEFIKKVIRTQISMYLRDISLLFGWFLLNFADQFTERHGYIFWRLEGEGK